jgi:hypothetical protein
MQPTAKVCPECGSEYLPHVEICADCDVAVVHPEELAPPDELPDASELVAIRAASVSWSRLFSEFLSDRGVTHRIDLPPSDPDSAGRRSHEHQVCVYVRAEDRERVLALDAQFMREQFPDLDAEEDEEPASDDEGCPACGSALDPSASECPDCGLPFGEPE